MWEGGALQAQGAHHHSPGQAPSGHRQKTRWEKGGDVYNVCAACK